MTTPLSCLGISSMGCPEYTLEEILSLAEEYRLQYVELRSLGGTLDLPAYLESASAPAPGRPRVRLLATSLCLLKPSPEAETEFYRFAELATRFNAPYLRVFGDGGSVLGDEIGEEALAKAAKTIESLRIGLREHGCPAEILLETHDLFSSSKRCLALNAHLDQPVKILWDSFHTWNLGGESPQETWERISHWVEHIHHHDSPLPPGTGQAAFVATGQGQYPCTELLTLLTEQNFQGGLTLEWEKLWHPEIPPLREVLGDFVKMFGARKHLS